jgi:hypothetical protein
VTRTGRRNGREKKGKRTEIGSFVRTLDRVLPCLLEVGGEDDVAAVEEKGQLGALGGQREKEEEKKTNRFLRTACRPAP